MRRFLVSAAFAVTVFALTGMPASASYPPGTTAFLGSFYPGQSTNTTLVGYASGSSVSFVVNGTADGAGVAGTDGSLPISVSVTDPHVAVNGNAPILLNYGLVTVTATGTVTGGGPITNTATLDVVQPATASSSPGTTPTTITPGGPAAATTTPTTQATAPGAATTPNATSTPNSSSSSSNLAFTGADIAAMVAGGIALIALGTFLVVVTRRRAHRNQT